jgi:hypothetical protein
MKARRVGVPARSSGVVSPLGPVVADAATAASLAEHAGGDAVEFGAARGARVVQSLGGDQQLVADARPSMTVTSDGCSLG